MGSGNGLCLFGIPVMVCCLLGTKPFSEPIIAYFTDAYMCHSIWFEFDFWNTPAHQSYQVQSHGLFLQPNLTTQSNLVLIRSQGREYDSLPSAQVPPIHNHNIWNTTEQGVWQDPWAKFVQRFQRYAFRANLNGSNGQPRASLYDPNG